MTPHKQLFLHAPHVGVYGDCGRTAIACLLDMCPEDVPHFWYDGSHEGADRADVWLREHGLGFFSVPFEVEDPQIIMDNIGERYPGAHYLMTGGGRYGTTHVVVCRGNKIVHDPSPWGSSVVGPGEDGLIWVEVLTKVL